MEQQAEVGSRQVNDAVMISCVNRPHFRGVLMKATRALLKPSSVTRKSRPIREE